jgi:hypothetical protein
MIRPSEVGADLVWHPGPAALSDAQRLETPAVDLGLPAVIGRALDPHRPAGGRHIAQLLGQREAAQTESEQRVMLCHVLLLLPLVWSLKEREEARGRPGQLAGASDFKVWLSDPQVLRVLGVGPT